MHVSIHAIHKILPCLVLPCTFMTPPLTNLHAASAHLIHWLAEIVP